MATLSCQLIDDAEACLKGQIRRTPVEYSPKLSDSLGQPATLKLECFQVTGSFKVRGAYFRLSLLSQAEADAGVASCSAGNHGIAMAYAGNKLGIAVTIYVPRDIDQAKYQAMLALGAEVVRSELPGYDDTLAWASQQAARTSKCFISAFDDYAIMAGNGGTLAAELIRQVPDARTFVVPVGGGGLSAGFVFYAKAKLPDCTIIGCQHELSPALKLSLETGKAVTRLPAVDTVAGGIEGGIGAKCFAVLAGVIDRVALVSEAEIFDAFNWTLANHQYLVEPTAAVPLAACISGKVGKIESPICVVISGRNVAMTTIKQMLEHNDSH